jgi:hypothetical protein
MATNPPFLPVGTASISWVDSGGAVHLRVYATDGYTVNERCFDDGAWTTGIFSQAGGTVSATSWTDSGGLHIRVYCTNETPRWNGASIRAAVGIRGRTRRCEPIVRDLRV